MERNRWNTGREVLVAAVLILAVAICSATVFQKLSYQWNWAVMVDYWRVFLLGLGLTVVISLGALVVSIVIGVALAAAQLSGSVVLRWSARAYVELIRGTPLLVQLLIGYFVIANALGLKNEFVVGVVLLSVFAGAYLAEILRGGVASVSASQIEAARAVGFDRIQIFRFVTAPQALRRVLPAMTGEFVSLVKNSSLLSVIGIQEFTYQAQVANAATYNSLEAFIPLALGYLALTLPMAGVAAWMERRLRYED